MPGVTCEDLINALRESGLHDETRMAVIEREVAAVGDDPQIVIRHLVLQNHSTLFQLKKLIHNKASELFVGPFVVLDKIGEGGMGKVYKVITWRQPDRLLALKVVRAHLLANPIIKKRYEREVHAATSLRHPNIVSVFDSGECDGRYYLAMEFVDGIDLSHIVRDYEQLRVPEACEYVRQAALGLHHAHESGFVHRDVKPSNILVCGERHVPEATGSAFVKILDMGLVRAAGFDDIPERSDLTRLGTVVGTPDYMAPEQARNSSTVDARADIYSLGCTLYFLLTGRPPYPDGSPMDKLFKHQLEPAPIVRDIRPDVPEQLSRLVAKFMSKTPEGRPGSAAMAAAMLEPFTRYDFRPPRGADHDAVRLPAAPTAARASYSGHYSLADDASQVGDPNDGRPGSSSQLPALNGSDSGVSLGNHTPTGGSSTGHISERGGAAVLDRPRTKTNKKRKRSRKARRQKARYFAITAVWIVGFAALALLVWALIRNMANG